ncbi:MAG: hypothetical protein WAU39_21585, partial [Polyangiales bacterium]
PRGLVVDDQREIIAHELGRHEPAKAPDEQWKQRAQAKPESLLFAQLELLGDRAEQARAILVWPMCATSAGRLGPWLVRVCRAHGR